MRCTGHSWPLDTIRVAGIYAYCVAALEVGAAINQIELPMAANDPIRTLQELSLYYRRLKVPPSPKKYTGSGPQKHDKQSKGYQNIRPP